MQSRTPSIVTCAHDPSNIQIRLFLSLIYICCHFPHNKYNIKSISFATKWHFTTCECDYCAVCNTFPSPCLWRPCIVCSCTSVVSVVALTKCFMYLRIPKENMLNYSVEIRFRCVVRFSFIIVNSSKFRPLRWLFFLSPSLRPHCVAVHHLALHTLCFETSQFMSWTKSNGFSCAEWFHRRNEVKKDADKCIENLFLLFTFTTKKRHCVAPKTVGERKICISMKLTKRRWSDGATERKRKLKMSSWLWFVSGKTYH